MMDDYLTGFGDEYSDDFEDNYEDFAPVDPFEGLTRGQQDLFFRVLDLLPREQLEPAMDYFMDHPAKIRALVDYVKQKKEMLENNDTEELKKLFERERIVIQKLEDSTDEYDAAIQAGAAAV